MQEKIASQQQSAKHLAARAVMAYRAGFPVTLFSNERPSGIVCDWKGLRDSFHNDAKLLGRALAFVYVEAVGDCHVGWNDRGRKWGMPVRYVRYVL